MEKTIRSEQYSLAWRDVLKGLLMAALTPAIVIIQQSIEAGSFVFNWQQIGMAAVAGGMAYIVKNFFEPSKTVKVLNH